MDFKNGAKIIQAAAYNGAAHKVFIIFILKKF